MAETERSISLDGVDLLAFLGHRDAHLRRLEEAFAGHLVVRGDELRLFGPEDEVARMEAVVAELLEWARSGRPVDRGALERILAGEGLAPREAGRQAVQLPGGVAGRVAVEARTPGQQRYLQAMQEHDVVFAIGPAGTGKTYLAVVRAVQALQRREVDRIFLVRPAVEAGEQLGFLPGDLQEKVDPYLRPLYDALTDCLGATKVARLLSQGTIEVAPLAYMRGRTLNRAFVILDEGQNSTLGQMKMFLTRIGEGTRAVVTGDVTQVDLADPAQSGLLRVRPILDGLEGVAFLHLGEADVVRHPLVRRIVSAFEMVERDGNPGPGSP